MGTAVLRGISAALLVTVLTLLAGLLWRATGLGGLSVSNLVDIGLLVSCLVGGYRAGQESGAWVLGGLAGAGYVGVAVLILALFLPVSSWGIMQVLAEGGVIGLIAGAFGAGSQRQGRSVRSRSRSSSYLPWGSDERSGSDWDERSIRTGTEGSDQTFGITSELERDVWDSPRLVAKRSQEFGEESSAETSWNSSGFKTVSENRDNGRYQKVSPDSGYKSRAWWEEESRRSG